MAQRYEQAWHKVYYDSPRWMQQTVIEEPTGRHASAIAHEAMLLAERDNKPISTGTPPSKADILNND